MKHLNSLASALVLLSVAAFATNAHAQVVWTQSSVNGHWYTTEVGNQTWCDQEAIAQSYGGHLATVRDQPEQDWIWTTYGGPTQYLNIGASRVGVAWTWASGEPFNLWPTNQAGWNPWQAPEPSGPPEDKGVLMGPWVGKWNDHCGCCGPNVLPVGLVEVISGDCNQNQIPDAYEIATGAALDCNGNGVLDSCDIASGTSLDCNANGIPDSCDITSGVSVDCNGNGIPDNCDLASGAGMDCNANGILDSCDITSGTSLDCNANGIPDSCDIASGTSPDPNGNGIPEECESSITTYCSPAAPNSVSANGSHISVQGTPSTILNNLVFTVSSLPANKPGLFIYAPFQNHLPAGNGFVCLGGPVQRVQPGHISNAQGIVTFPADLTQFPFTGGFNTILPGSTWNFQFWHRDPLGGLFGFNFSDAAELTFAP